MLKRLKSVSMLLFLMGASTGAAYAVANPGVTEADIVTALESAVIPVNTVQIKGQAINGSGSEADPWGP